jgi:hypothetical protein
MGWQQVALLFLLVTTLFVYYYNCRRQKRRSPQIFKSCLGANAVGQERHPHRLSFIIFLRGLLPLRNKQRGDYNSIYWHSKAEAPQVIDALALALSLSTALVAVWRESQAAAGASPRQ